MNVSDGVANTINNSTVVTEPTTAVPNTSHEKYIGLGLAVASSFLIGASFVITKIGLTDASAHNVHGESYGYLRNAKWWAGLVTMVLGEAANFAAYSFAPAILVTPLGALSVLISSLLATFFLNERLRRDSYIGCSLCLIGSVVIVLHAPEEHLITSVDEIMSYAMHPLFIVYALAIVSASMYLIFKLAPRIGKSNMLVYIGICSLIGSISVMAAKAFGVALKLTFEGSNQLGKFSTYFFALVVLVSALTQINFFNKALNAFSTNLVTPVYYVCFTTATIMASFVLFRSAGAHSSSVSVVTSFCGFVIIFIGVVMLNFKPPERGPRRLRGTTASSADILLEDNGCMSNPCLKPGSGEIPIAGYSPIKSAVASKPLGHVRTPPPAPRNQFLLNSGDEDFDEDVHPA